MQRTFMKRKFADAALALLVAAGIGCDNTPNVIPRNLAEVPAAPSQSAAIASEWSNWRGPEQNGVSRETGLPESWDPDKGENVAWKNPTITGMSSPIVMNGKLYT